MGVDKGVHCIMGVGSLKTMYAFMSWGVPVSMVVAVGMGGVVGGERGRVGEWRRLEVVERKAVV